MTRMTTRVVKSRSEDFAQIKEQLQTHIGEADYKDLFSFEQFCRDEEGIQVHLIETMGKDKNVVGFTTQVWSYDRPNDFKGYSLITHTYIRNFSSKEVAVRWVKSQAKSNL